jgi:hypothetical protein
MRRTALIVGIVSALQLGTAWAAKPAALVEDVAGATPPLRMLDYVNAGQVVDLGKGGKLTLGYFASCVHEEISGGRVTVGDKESSIAGGTVTRSTVECDGGRLDLAANQAVQSGAVAVRSIGTVSEANITVFDVSPIMSLPKAGRVVIKRVDVVGERHTVEVKPADGTQEPLRLDLAEQSVQLVPGGTYMVSVGGLSQMFKVAESAGRGNVPLVGRWVPF